MRQPFHILLVEEHDLTRLTLNDLIMMLFPHAQVTCVTDAGAALHCYEEQGATLIVVGDHMPVIDGISLIKRLRMHDHTVPIVVISARFDIDTPAYAAGASEVLIKPIYTAALHSVLSAFMTPETTAQNGSV